MIHKFVSDISTQLGIKLSKVSLIDGQHLGCIDAQLLKMSAKGHTVGALVFQADIEKLKNV